MRKSLFAFVIATLLASMPGYAQTASSYRYKWVDAQGMSHFSDNLSAEAMKYGYDLINDRGMTVKHVPRQLNAQERIAANKLATEQAAQERIKQDTARAEAQILLTYPDEASYKVALQQTVDAIDQQIRTTQINLRSQEKALSDLLDRAADIELSKQPVPKFMADNISRQRNVVTGQRSALGRLQAERAQTVTTQTTQLARYRELRAAEDAAEH